MVWFCPKCLLEREKFIDPVFGIPVLSDLWVQFNC